MSKMSDSTNEAIGRQAMALVMHSDNPSDVGKALVDTVLHLATTEHGGAASGLDIDRYELRRRLHHALRQQASFASGVAHWTEQAAGADFSNMPAAPERPAPDGTVWVLCRKRETGPEQKPGWRWEPIDAELAPLVRRLQGPQPRTMAACSMHGKGFPHVMLEDGRFLLLVSREDHEYLDEVYRAGKAVREATPTDG